MPFLKKIISPFPYRTVLDSHHKPSSAQSLTTSSTVRHRSSYVTTGCTEDRRATCLSASHLWITRKPLFHIPQRLKTKIFDKCVATYDENTETQPFTMSLLRRLIRRRRLLSKVRYDQIRNEEIRRVTMAHPKNRQSNVAVYSAHCSQNR